MPVLCYAAPNWNIGIAKALLAKGASPNTTDINGRTPLSWASGAGRISVVRLLLDHPEIKVSIEDNERDTALWWAADVGHSNVITLLSKLEGRAGDVEAENDNKTTPLIRAAKMGHDAAVRLLFGRENVNPDADDVWDARALWYAIDGGYEKIIELLLDVDKAKPYCGCLSRATEQASREIVDLLLQTGKLDVNVGGDTG